MASYRFLVAALMLGITFTCDAAAKPLSRWDAGIAGAKCAVNVFDQNKYANCIIKELLLAAKSEPMPKILFDGSEEWIEYDSYIIEDVVTIGSISEKISYRQAVYSQDMLSIEGSLGLATNLITTELAAEYNKTWGREYGVEVSREFTIFLEPDLCDRWKVVFLHRARPGTARNSQQSIAQAVKFRVVDGAVVNAQPLCEASTEAEAG